MKRPNKQFGDIIFNSLLWDLIKSANETEARLDLLEQANRVSLRDNTKHVFKGV